MAHKVLTDGNGSKLIRVVGMGEYMPLIEYDALRAQLTANTAPIVRLNEYCQLNGVGALGDSVSDSVIKHIETLRLERDALAAKLEQVKSSYKNLCGAIGDADDLEEGTEEHEAALGRIFEVMRDGWQHVND